MIVNADDFGLTDGVSLGILQCLRSGIVTSTSVMVCDPAARRRLNHWRDSLRGHAGVHLQLTDGRALTDPAAVFPRFPGALGELNPAEVRREWHAQVDAFRSCGLEPTHIDTHHHVHSHPVAFEVYCEIARAYNLPARTLDAETTTKLRAWGVRCADLSAGWDGCSAESLLELVLELFATCGDATIEVVCHPARVDAELEKASVYVSPRARELEVLCEPGLSRMLGEKGIELGSHYATVGERRTDR